jgi:hypothetical protein
MRRRYRHTRVVMIPDWLMDAEGEYEHTPDQYDVPVEERVKAPWSLWCEATGYSKLEFLRESIRRSLASIDEDPAA